MTACLLLLATLLSDAPDAVSIGQPQFVSGYQVEITLENRPELPPRQTQIELDLVYHLTPTGADTIREIRQPLGESGVPFDLSSQAAQIHPVSVAFDADQFLSVIQNSGDLTLSLCPLGKIAPLTADLGTPKQLGVDSIEPTFAAFTGALKTNDLTLAIPAAGGKHRAATLLRWHITQSATGVTATPLSDDAP